ncbi:unnamed protein product [Linum trigynum]|uniref:Leucine-rich repeat-containing N-terminal plant-type domain-containing protein n=1 Tax=Linum trigynum TaxID=586398 RepID=A0AAV2DAW8_9ROSI
MGYGWFITGFIWAVALFTVPEWKSCYGCWEQERISLLHLKASLSNPPALSSWSAKGTNHSDDDCCQWDGVDCDLLLDYPYDSYINSQAKPDINASLFLPFQELRRLKLQGFHITGCIQNQGWPHLESLDIDDSTISCNNFLETVATVMTNLTRLRVADSDLSSPIPPALCTLKRLRESNLRDNRLRGELPQCLSNLTSLQRLSIGGNQFSGDISLSPLPALLSLEYVDISNNQFRIPTSLFPFFNHSHLQYFWGGDNREIYGDDHLDLVLQQGTPRFQLIDLELSTWPDYGGYVGPFPKFLYHQTRLKLVFISNFNITGVDTGFPWWLVTNNTHLEFLSLTDCSLSGHFQIPIHQQQHHPHANLRGLSISGNDFFPSTIPPDICAALIW